MTVLGIVSGNDSVTAQQIEQISEFPQHQGTAKDLEIIPELPPENTSITNNHTNVIGEALPQAIAQNQPVNQEADIELTV
ncbi:MAG: hypothetical protein HC907_12910, partial [Richelia sp. SM1_7_0]|nr:hypothetical protein [Richelia sp. SM1_7_0]